MDSGFASESADDVCGVELYTKMWQQTKRGPDGDTENLRDISELGDVLDVRMSFGCLHPGHAVMPFRVFSALGTGRRTKGTPPDLDVGLNSGNLTNVTDHCDKYHTDCEIYKLVKDFRLAYLRKFAQLKSVLDCD